MPPAAARAKAAAAGTDAVAASSPTLRPEMWALAAAGCAPVNTGDQAASDPTARPHIRTGAALQLHPTPHRIVLNLTANPAVSQAVTWRTDMPIDRPLAEIIPATGAAGFDAGARSIPAVVEPVNRDDGRMVYHHSLVFDDLQPDTLYAYRVGADEAWSEWCHFRTACREPDPVQFVFFGDPQEEVFSKCTQVFRAAFQAAPEADFWHFIGDLVDNGDRDAE
ncbi:MAG: fibronectin type III domain-containing protein [Deltaproteobacteria bacterium]|nr:fibronectin type III domain-containing protein [Candidatus Anaeroferrophillacea bacterium]